MTSNISDEATTRIGSKLRKAMRGSLDRTRRLLYVTCSRAEQSLALVAYTSDPQKVRTQALREGWFEPDEIVLEGAL